MQYGINIGERRIGQSLRRVDPEGVNRRCSRQISRRKYRNKGPHAVWHIDCNHKVNICSVYIFEYDSNYAKYIVIRVGFCCIWCC